MTPREFIMQKQFKKFVDGFGEWKWSTDQTLLNYWVRKSGMGLHRMDWKWNGLIGGIKEDKIKDVHFLHFYMRNGNMQGDVSELEQLKRLV